VRVAIVGAGLAGLMAARPLAAAGHDVVLLDKGRSPGGRLATRRVGDAVVDHGAQFFTVRSDAFAASVDAWRRDGLVTEWCRGFGAEPDGHPRYAVRGGMNALAKHLARGLDVRCSTMAFAIRPATDGGWSVGIDDGSAVPAEALVVTTPLPQASSLLMTSGVAVPVELARTEYDRTLALLAVLDRPPAVPAPGGVQRPDDAVSFVGDNVAKGISTVPALTVHATAEWSEAHWDDDPETVHALLLSLARPWLGEATVVASQVKRWRFATPRTPWPDPCWVATEADGADAPLVLAGDAFAGPRVEGAALSGLAASAALLGR